MKIECRACGATGLYKGFAEPEGHAVACNQCRGKGYRDVQILDDDVTSAEFSGRKRKPGIRYVITDGGLWMTRGRQPAKITVEEFYND